jgi:hypothetical protein
MRDKFLKLLYPTAIHNMPESDRNFTDSLIALKSQYERSLMEASTEASHLREQLSHVNALLLNQLLPSNGVAPQLAKIGHCSTNG